KSTRIRCIRTRARCCRPYRGRIPPRDAARVRNCQATCRTRRTSLQDAPSERGARSCGRCAPTLCRRSRNGKGGWWHVPFQKSSLTKALTTEDTEEKQRRKMVLKIQKYKSSLYFLRVICGKGHVVGALACTVVLQAQTAPSQKTGTPEQRTARYFESVRQSPSEMLAFLLSMPKGGDLHNHL